MTDFKSIPVLVPGHLNPDTLATLEETFDVRRVAAHDAGALSATERAEIRGMAMGGRGSAEFLGALPNLEIIAHFGVGYDGIDTAHASERGIMVTNTPDVLSEEVADTTLGLLLSTVRELPQAERYLRAGRWEKDGAYPLTPMTLQGRKVGIMGLGRIGLAIARRLEGFGVEISYYNRNRRDDVAYAYHPTLLDLAGAVDTLIVAAPGGAHTQHAVDANVLKALGPEGVLVNIGRGSIVDEDALAEALETGTIRAAGLDVFEHEPHVPERLMKLPNAVLLPHVASASRATRRAMGELVIDNLRRWFDGRDVATPVAESVGAGLRRRPEPWA